jgi:hypothetical protein
VSKLLKPYIIIKITGLAVLGLLIVLAGFAYDVLFAGIPYQDPSPELQARYDFHSSIAGLFYKTGGIVLLVGIVVIPIIWKKTKRKSVTSI